MRFRPHSEARHSTSTNANRFVGSVCDLLLRFDGLFSLRDDFAELLDMDANEVAFAPRKGDAADDVLSDYPQHEDIWERARSRHADPGTSLRDIFHIARYFDTIQRAYDGNPVGVSARRSRNDV